MLDRLRLRLEPCRAIRLPRHQAIGLVHAGRQLFEHGLSRRTQRKERVERPLEDAERGGTGLDVGAPSRSARGLRGEQAGGIAELTCAFERAAQRGGSNGIHGLGRLQLGAQASQRSLVARELGARRLEALRQGPALLHVLRDARLRADVDAQVLRTCGHAGSARRVGHADPQALRGRGVFLVGDLRELVRREPRIERHDARAMTGDLSETGERGGGERATTLQRNAPAGAVDLRAPSREVCAFDRELLVLLLPLLEGGLLEDVGGGEPLLLLHGFLEIAEGLQRDVERERRAA